MTATSPERITCACGSRKTPYRDKCLSCERERRRLARKNDPENVRNRERMKRRTTDAKKKRARDTANDAVRRGKIDRQPCEQCGNAGAQMHHDDYDKPLAVRWLCRRHHAELHRRSAAT